ncbi:MAG: NAD-dependent protein deacylase [Candidatus Glassbacteria bacterium RIFCSPLOWO2_12_FULL_58_11]|uniref:NAD-dependent protein deacylase n=2 Tax=Candidatus Glassiibacteriota TaxID=1817805 RepID=A0A1F5Z472_9BACT|nr:MAG: NAD-dependent protein deacylase [Candidatus Glassbacteria bacterium RIFCSPLOWO2_12_FULL_58_11]
MDRELLVQAAAWIAESRRPVAFTGAGVSRESGIPTFREATTGFWERYDPYELATVEGFLKNPKLVWEWYAFRRQLVRETEPNPGHKALAELEHLLPELMLITQNVDNLHRRAGSRRIIELHGNITRVKCFKEGTLYEDWSDKDYRGEIPPRCKACYSYLRPDVVWFGESLPARALEEAFKSAENCDLMLVVGTSGLVQPAASLPGMARRRGARIIEVNPDPSEITPSAHLFLQGKSGEVLPEVVARVGAIRREG